MSEVIHNAQQDYWRAPVVQAATPGLVEVCDRCNTEFMVGARFCHVCGAARQAQAMAESGESWTRHLEFQNIQQRLGLSTAPLIAFVMGIGCALAALGVGLIFTQEKLIDWQAVQIWRIEWLLASGVAFLAGILLKRSSQ
jgi:hypothetical protein